MNYTKEITAMMHKALPRLKDLSFGCKVRWKVYTWEYKETRDLIKCYHGYVLLWPSWKPHENSSYVSKPQDAEILWHDITPLHLLEVLWFWYAIDNGWYLIKKENRMDGYWIDFCWNYMWIRLDLTLPLDQQSERVQKQIYLLLKSVLWKGKK